MLGLCINNYEVLSLIGEGGMGSVYLARHPFIGRQAAIKVLRADLARDPALVTRFLNEARAANAIQHPHLIDIIDVGMLDDGTPYLMMEYLEGQSLGALLTQQPQLPVPQAMDLTCQAANALAAAHTKGIVHRDLKPDNLFLVSQPAAKCGLHLKVLDFGIAKLTGCMRNSPKTSTGIILGTPVYMSPEQCRGIPDAIDCRSDIYSLGVILFHMVCGRPPFLSEAIGELMAMHMLSDVPKPSDLVPDLRPGLEEVILRSLAKAPDARFSSMADFEDALHAVEEGRGHVKPTPTVIDPAASPPPAKQQGNRPAPAREAPAASRRAKESKESGTKTVRRRKPYRVLAIGSVLLVGAAVAGLVVVRGRKAASAGPPLAPAVEAMRAPAVETTPSPPPDLETTVTVSISTSPSEADVINSENGQLLGITPYKATHPHSGTTLQVVLVKAGYQPQPKTLSLAQDNTLDLILVKDGASKEHESAPVRAKPKLQPKREKPKVDPDAMRKL